MKRDKDNEFEKLREEAKLEAMKEIELDKDNFMTEFKRKLVEEEKEKQRKLLTKKFEQGTSSFGEKLNQKLSKVGNKLSDVGGNIGGSIMEKSKKLDTKNLFGNTKVNLDMHTKRHKFR